ncbi:GNAT family N-acetyltransferase [Streptomyces sp. NBC_01320]|uniref:GNAT family N-acetyltransferase n=1 Tax=Streptomyces sp. NBC_01320 TaxID=2903824 RepID=UPI002E0D4CF7|nr:GNAT family N-acetyltransferase [Streptomyces sp. NBC_01320]
MNSAELVFRRADDSDAADIADVWLRSFTAALPNVRRAHGDDEVRDWFSYVVVPQQEIWVAIAEGSVIGLLVLDDEELEQFYLDPSWRGRGVGDRFMTLAKQQRPGGLGLWTFQVNGPARRFYERHGFIAVEHTDGLRNEEREPDVRYTWQPHE